MGTRDLLKQSLQATARMLVFTLRGWKPQRQWVDVLLWVLWTLRTCQFGCHLAEAGGSQQAEPCHIALMLTSRNCPVSVHPAPSHLCCSLSSQLPDKQMG